MGCTNEPNDLDAQMLEKSARGENCKLDSNILEITPVVETKISAQIQREIAFVKEEGVKNAMKRILPPRTEELNRVVRLLDRVDRVTSLTSPEVKMKRVLVLPHIEPTHRIYFKTDISKDVEKVKNTDAEKTIIITTEKKNPVFATDHKESGEKLSEHIKNYPKDCPEVKVYTPVFPTVKNLERMLQGKAPFSPWGQKIELHHYQQDPKGPLMMTHTKFHDQVPHVRNGLTPEERAKYENIQKPNIYKAAAKAYLGDRLPDLKLAKEL